MMCVWVSESPGINTRPPPSITVAFLEAFLLALADTSLILLPSTSTSVALVSWSFVPSNTRTFLNTI
ncbi:hypothetical protein [Lutibacter agarilyticus]|uniref:hypothetical protein n=1 Tax=Lutibacter agarilyticus TaxID=1109740 RepID=UPI001FEBD76F|nr:hypothetical protein [Lutibacter agarilyticus]